MPMYVRSKLGSGWKSGHKYYEQWPWNKWLREAYDRKAKSLRDLQTAILRPKPYSSSKQQCWSSHSGTNTSSQIRPPVCQLVAANPWVLRLDSAILQWKWGQERGWMQKGKLSLLQSYYGSTSCTSNSQYFRSTVHLITNTHHLLHIILPVPSCLEGFWVALSFEADWLSAQPMSSLRLCTSLYTSTRWME